MCPNKDAQHAIASSLLLQAIAIITRKSRREYGEYRAASNLAPSIQEHITNIQNIPEDQRPPQLRKDLENWICEQKKYPETLGTRTHDQANQDQANKESSYWGLNDSYHEILISPENSGKPHNPTPTDNEVAMKKKKSKAQKPVQNRKSNGQKRYHNLSREQRLSQHRIKRIQPR